MAVLELLAEHRGEVVRHAELTARVWAGIHVAPGALARAISILRDALDDDAKSPTLIETVPKRGYRLMTADRRPESPAPPARTAGRRYWRPPAGLAATFAAGLTIFISIGSPDRPAHPAPSHGTRSENENAVVFYTRAVAADPQSSDAQAGLAMAYAFRADYRPDGQDWAEKAIDAAGRATSLDPRNPRAISALGTAYFKAGRIDRAHAAYRQAMTLAESPDTRHNLGLVLMAKGQLIEALEVLEQRILAEPLDSAGYTALADALLQVGRVDAARAAIARALALTPLGRGSNLVAAAAAFHAGNPREAHARLARLVEADRDCAPCLTQLGLADELSGHLAEAETHYREAARRFPRFSGASLRLARLLASTGRRSEANQYLTATESSVRQAHERQPEITAHVWRLAAVAAVRGDVAAALRWYAQAADCGHRNTLWDEWDPLFAVINQAPEFRAVVDRTRARAAAEAVEAIVRRLPATFATVDASVRPILAVPEVF